MYDELKARIGELLAWPRPLKAQTERQLTQRVQEHQLEPAEFLVEAAGLLEEHEVEILFAPQFTPTMDDQAELSDLLYHWRPGPDELSRMVDELTDTVECGWIILPDGEHAKLTLHEVMVQRYVRLLRLDNAPSPSTTATIRESLSSDLWPLGVALMRQRPFDPQRQLWFAAFVNHLAGLTTIGRGLLETTADFVGRQSDLSPKALLAEAAGQIRAATKSVTFAQGGRTYWSPDVAQHHQYRGQGEVDEQLVRQRQDEAEWLEQIEQALQSFEHGETAAAEGGRS